MNYEKIIIELMGRIQILEEQVATLMGKQSKVTEQDTNKIGTVEIREYITELKEAARKAGKTTLVLRSGDIHKDLGLTRAMPQVCNAMWQLMNEGDVVLHTTPSNLSSTIEIEYYV